MRAVNVFKKVTALVVMGLLMLGLVPARSYAVEGVHVFTEINTGYWHSLALKSDGTVWAWGGNSSGQLGDGTTVNKLKPVQVKNLDNVMKIYAGFAQSFAIDKDGTVWGWGVNNTGQLGDGTKTNRLVPVRITQMTDVNEIATGRYSTVYLKNDGTLWSSGENNYGQLGDGTKLSRTQYKQIPNIVDVITVSAGQGHFVAVTKNGDIYSWGANASGQLGNGGTSARLIPTKIPTTIPNIKKIDVGRNNNLVLTQSGDVYFWGAQIGNGTHIESLVPKCIIRDILNINIGYDNSQIIKNDGSVWSWGENEIGELGDGTTINSDVIIKAVIPEKITEIYGTVGSFFAKSENGGVYFWGDNRAGQIGLGYVSPIGGSYPNKISNFNILGNIPSTDSVTSALEQVESSLSQEDLDTALELINQLPDSAEKTEFLNRVNVIQTQISVNKVTELTTQAENMVNSGSIDGLDEILLQIDSITNTLPDSVERTNVVNKTNVIKTEGSKIKIYKLTQQANDLIASGNTEGLDEILLEIGNITNDLPNSAEKDQVIRDANLKSAKTAVSKAEITKTAEDIQLALDFTNKLPQSAEKVVLIERIYAVKGEPVPPMNDKTVLSSAENKLKLAETYKRDPYISNAEEAVNSLYDSPEKDAMLDRLETLRTSVEDEQLQKLVKTIESKVVMAEKYKKEAYINSAREALEQLPDGAEKEAFEARLDALEEETPMDGTPSSARAVKVAVRATERAERTPTRYSIIYADRKTSALTDATPEKANLVERVATLKAQYQNVIAEQNAEKAIANAVRYVELAEKYKNNYYFTKAEGLVNSLTDGDSKTTLSNRLEALRPVVYPSAEQTLIDEAAKAVESAEKYPSNTAYVSRAVKAVGILPEGQIKTNLLERVEVLTTKAA